MTGTLSQQMLPTIMAFISNHILQQQSYVSIFMTLTDFSYEFDLIAKKTYMDQNISSNYLSLDLIKLRKLL
jgi:hypothetical protein